MNVEKKSQADYTSVKKFRFSSLVEVAMYPRGSEPTIELQLFDADLVYSTADMNNDPRSGF